MLKTQIYSIKWNVDWYLNDRNQVCFVHDDDIQQDTYLLRNYFALFALFKTRVNIQTVTALSFFFTLSVFMQCNMKLNG